MCAVSFVDLETQFHVIYLIREWEKLFIAHNYTSDKFSILLWKKFFFFTKKKSFFQRFFFETVQIHNCEAKKNKKVMDASLLTVWRKNFPPFPLLERKKKRLESSLSHTWKWKKIPTSDSLSTPSSVARDIMTKNQWLMCVVTEEKVLPRFTF